MAYGLHSRLRFNDYFGSAIDVQISKRDYTGSSTNLTGSGHPLHLRLENANEDVAPGIRGMVAEINIRATSLTQHDAYFNADNRMFKIDIYKDSTLYIGGLFIDPENSSRPIQQIYEANIKASTGIGYLRNYEFKQADGTLYRDEMTLHSCLYKCLLNIDEAPKFYDASDIYNNASPSESPLTSDYLDPEVFKESWNKAKDCYAVINEILAVKHAKMFRYRDGWYVMPIDYTDETIDFRVIENADGEQTSTLSNVQLHVDVTNGSVAKSSLNVPIDKSANLYYDRGWNQVTVTRDKGLENYLFDPWYESDFNVSSSGGSIPNFGIQFNQETGELILQHLATPTDFESDNAQYKLADIEQDGIQTLSVKLKLSEVRVETRIRMFIRGSDGTVKWLSKDGHWNTPPTWLILTEEADTFDIVSDPIDIDGALYIEFAIREDDTQRSYYNPYDPAYSKVLVQDIDISLSNITWATEEDKHTLTGDSNNLFVSNQVNLILGEFNDNFENNSQIYIGGMYKLSGGELIGITTFFSTKTETIAASMDITEMLANRYMMIHGKARKILGGNFLAHFNPLSMPVYLELVYAFSTFDYDVRYGTWNIDGYEVYNEASDYLLLESGDKLLLESGDGLLLETG